MTLDILVDNMISDTLKSIRLFRPELTLCVTIVLLLVTRIFRTTSWISPTVIALVGSLVAFWLALPPSEPPEIAEGPTQELVTGTEAPAEGKAEESPTAWEPVAAGKPQELFTGMLVYDSLTIYMRSFLLLFVILFVVLATITGLTNRDDGPDFYTLLLGATLGMCIMASANHLIIIFLGVEMASVPSYVLAGFVRGRRRASEAALKYAVYGAGAAGVMLYGISLLAGVLGTAHLPTMARQLAAMDLPAMMAGGEGTGTLMVLALGGLMTMVGLAFKLSAVPFHFWCPDVFEGATAEVNAFLSVASKAAALALLVRVTVGLGVLPGMASESDPSTAGAQATAGVFQYAADESEEADPASDHGAVASLAPVRQFMVRLIAILAVITCTFGNLAAYGQTNIKRMLAYSTIAHAGYMMMAVAAAIALAGRAEAAQNALAALLLYVGFYLFMNLGAFAIVAFLRNAMQSEEIADYAGLIRTAPVVTVAMVVILFSLIGLPPLAGFIGKFFIFYSLVEAGGPLMIFLLVVGGINTVLSLVYYLRVAKVMCIDTESDSRGPISLGLVPVFYAAIVAAPLVVFGIWPDEIREIALAASKQLFT